MIIIFELCWLYLAIFSIKRKCYEMTLLCLVIALLGLLNVYLKFRKNRSKQLLSNSFDSQARHFNEFSEEHLTVKNDSKSHDSINSFDDSTAKSTDTTFSKTNLVADSEFKSNKDGVLNPTNSLPNYSENKGVLINSILSIKENDISSTLDDKQCNNATISKINFCFNCGCELVQGSNFCSNCGTKII